MNARKIISIMVIFTLILSILSIDRSYAAGGTNINLSLSPATAGRYEYYTNEETLVYLDLDLSGYDTNISNAELAVTVPKEYLASMIGSQIGSATGPVVTTTADGQYLLTYHFNKLTGGTSLRIPIRVQTLAGTTPENYVLPVNATLVASDGTGLATAEQLNLKQITRDPIISKWKSAPGGVTSNDGTITYGGQATAADSNIIQPGAENPQVFSFRVAYENPTNATTATYLGVRKYEKIIIRDTLTDGAVFVQSLNPGWIYDIATNTVSYTMDNPSLQNGWTTPVTFNAPSLSLIYPNGDVRNTFNNTASVEFVPQNKLPYESANVVSTDGINFRMTTTLPRAMTISKSSSSFADQITQKTTNKVWSCYVTNQSDSFGLENLVYEDSNLDSRLEYVSIRLMSTFNNLFLGTVDIECVDASGTVTTIAQDVSGGSIEYAIPSGTVKVYINSTTGSYLLPSKTFTFYVTTKLKDPENVHYNATTTANNRFSNTLKTSGEYVGTDTTASGIVTGNIYISPYDPQVYLTKSSSKTSLFVGESTTFTLRGYAQNTMMDPDTIRDSSVIDLLPQGLEYVAGSTSTANSNLFVSKEPTVVANYKGTGQTALIWTFANPLKPASSYFTLAYQAKASKNMTQGTNTNKAYWIWENNGAGTSGSQPVSVYPSPTYRSADIYDFDNDGNVTEYCAYSAANVTYTPPREVIASKYTKGSLDLEDTLDGGKTEIGDAFSYTLKVWNNSISDVNQFSAVEVLPYVGDKTIVADADGQYLPRNSEFKAELTGPVIAHIGYTVYYSTEVPASDSATSPADYSAGGGWRPETLVSDWSIIRGIKIVMNAGTTLKVNEVVKFYLPAKSPTDMSLVNGEEANNSFAISVNGEKDFLEANSVGVTLVSYKVSGTLFNDANKNGLLDDGEKVFANQEVRLYNEDGTPAVDLDGNPIKTITKADGTYQLTAYNHGNYYVHMAKPQYFETTTQGADDNTLASQISTTTGNTKVFSLTPEINSIVRNGGYYSVTGDLHLEKKVLDADGTAKAAGEGPFTFDITLDGKAYVGDVEIDGKTINVTDGKVSFKSGKEVWIRNIAEGTSYEVKETDTGDYTMSPADGSYTGVIKAYDQIALSFENTEKALGQLSINKTFLDPDGNKIEEARNFTILVTGPSYPDGQEMTLSNDKPLALTGLKYGTYEVKELNASLYNVTVSGTATLDIATKQGDITVTNKQKQVSATSIDIQKTVKGDPKTDETFTFELTPDEETFPMPEGSDGKQNVTVIGSGTTAFGTWGYTEPGVYTYQVKEVAGGNDHYTYDDTVYTITDTVRLNDSGDLEVARTIKNDSGDTIEGTLNFENQFKVKPVTPAAIDLQKAVTGNPKTDETFTFQLNPVAEPPHYPSLPKDVIAPQEITIDGSGIASFDTWTYTLPGVYTYQVKEVAGNNEHYAYDSTLYTIIDTVTQNNEGDLEVVRTVQKDSSVTVDGIPNFTNAFTAKPTMAPVIDVEKKITGEPKTDETFTFELTPEEDASPMPEGSDGKQDITITGAGTAYFGTWAYTKPGVYTYQVKEVAGTNADYDYDKTIFTITDTVTLKDNGDLEITRAIRTTDGKTGAGIPTFNNKYKSSEEFPSPAPNHNGGTPVQTGDSSQPYLMLIIALLSLIVLTSLGYCGFSTKRKTKHQDK